MWIMRMVWECLWDVSAKIKYTTLSLLAYHTILFAVLPDRAYDFVLRYERIGMLLLWALVFAGVGGTVMDGAIYFVFDVFCRIVGF